MKHVSKVKIEKRSKGDIVMKKKTYTAHDGPGNRGERRNITLPL